MGTDADAGLRLGERLIMLLANGINLPLVVLGGVLTLGPLTLLVTTLEAFTFRLMGRAGFRRAFGPVLVANLLSTAAGVILYGFQDNILSVAGITTSIPAFIRGYTWLGWVLVGLYWAKSVLVEGAWLSRRACGLRAAASRRRVLATTLVGNVATYAIVGPLFFYATRPRFSGLETTFDAKWTANRDVVVYYIGREDHSIRRAHLDGSREQVVSRSPATDFVISGDERRVVYCDDAFRAYVTGPDLPDPLEITRCANYTCMRGFSIAPDGQGVVFRECSDKAWQRGGVPTLIRVFDVPTRTVRDLGRVASSNEGLVAWSADGASVFVDTGQTPTRAFRLDADRFNETPEPLAAHPEADRLVENYLCLNAASQAHGRRYDRWDFSVTSANGLTLSYWPYFGARVHVTRDNQNVLYLTNDYGLLKFSDPWLASAQFLPGSDEILLEWWGQLYVLDAERRRLGLAINGDRPVLRTPEFRAHFRESE